MRDTITFNLVENATDSFAQAVDLFVLDSSPFEPSQLKRSILAAAHCVELLLKERLRRVHPAFIWENVDRYPNLDARTVNSSTAVDRLRTLAEIDLSDQDRRMLKNLRVTRNAIEHYEWASGSSDARHLVAYALSFSVDFAKGELKLDLAAPYQRDDSWQVLLDELTEYIEHHEDRVRQRLEGAGEPIAMCPECGSEAVSAFGGSCLVCGRWYEPPMEDDV